MVNTFSESLQIGCQVMIGLMKQAFIYSLTGFSLSSFFSLPCHCFLVYLYVHIHMDIAEDLNLSMILFYLLLSYVLSISLDESTFNSCSSV